MEPINYVAFIVVLIIVIVIGASMIRNPLIITESKRLLVDIIYWTPGLSQAVMTVYGGFSKFLTSTEIPSVPVKDPETGKPLPIGTGMFGTTVCYSGCDYKSLAEALAYANEGDTIRVMQPGMVFTEPLTITKNNLVIEANNSILDGSLISYITPKIGIEISAINNIKIKNMNITKFDYGIYLDYANEIIIDNVSSYGNEYHGIYLEDSSENNIVNSSFYSNRDSGIYMT